MGAGKNERGYALLMVLMIVLIFTVLGLSLLTMNINASKQFAMEEGNVQARHIAEMGVLHFKGEVKKALTAEEESVEDARHFCRHLEEKVNDGDGFPIISSGTNSEYVYEVLFNPEKCGEGATDDKYPIPFTSVAKSGGEDKSVIEAEIFLQEKEGPPVIPVIPEVEDEEDKNCGGIFGSLSCLLNEVLNLAEMTIDDVDSLLPGQKMELEALLTESLTIDMEEGVQLDLQVAEDLYITKLLNIKSDVCIKVGSNLSLVDSEGNVGLENLLNLESQAEIFVNGDANLPSTVLEKSNLDIYVLGDVYIDGKYTGHPKAPIYQSFPSGDTSGQMCNPPPETEVPNTPDPARSTIWVIDDSLEAVYVK